MDLFLYNARVWQGKARFASSIVLRRGRVAAVGDRSVTERQATGCTAIDCGGRTVIPGFFDPYFRLTEAFAPLPEKKREWKSCLLAWLRQVGDRGITTFISPELGQELPEDVLPVLRQLYREEVALPRLLFWQNGVQDPTAIQPMRRWPAFAGRLADPQVLLQPHPQPGLTAFAVPDGESLGRVLSLLEARPQETGRLQRTALLGAPCTTPEQLRIMGELKLEIVAFPGRLEESLLACTGLPGVSADTCCAWRTLSHLGANVAFGGLDRTLPFAALQQAVCRREVSPTGKEHPSREALTVEEALCAMSRTAARLDFWEDALGCLEPGWQADLQVLSADPFTCPAAELGSIHPLLVTAAGQILHREIS